MDATSSVVFGPAMRPPKRRQNHPCGRMPAALRLHPAIWATLLAVTEVPAGTTVIIGTVADNFADQLGRPKIGGNIQVFVPHVDFPYQEFRLASSSGTGPQIVVQSDDAVLRFRK
jgi:hypothetical protein